MKNCYSESDFIAHWVNQDRQAFNYLYDNYSPALYGIVIKMVKNDGMSDSVSFIRTLALSSLTLMPNADMYTERNHLPNPSLSPAFRRRFKTKE